MNLLLSIYYCEQKDERGEEKEIIDCIKAFCEESFD
jgi:hypothetical protein